MPRGWDREWLIQEDGETEDVGPHVPADSRISFDQGRHGRAGMARTRVLARARGERICVDDHQAMNTDCWAALAESEREQWGYAPRQTIGPLCFGMDRHDAVTTMAGHGFTAEQNEIERWNRGRSQWRVQFHRAEADGWKRPAVKCYFVEDVGLTCVLVDGLRGPQVTYEGIRLIGRVPSQLSQEMEAYATEHDAGIRFSPGGDMFVDGFEIELGAQRAGDNVVTWALFFDTREIAGSSWDIAPAEVWSHW
ncbi:hypothetical protein [Streptomyces sp. NPDC056817]|uniref:hypothetical protein n=1 Tax=Streptomyces sp. NPDC056817 TaxID=3345950 RepID=UPI0036BBF158